MTGRYKKYPEYLDSGIEWLKEMPAHWKLVKAKNIFKRVQRPVQPENGIITAFRDGEVTLRSKRRTDGFTNAVKEIGYQGVRKGDLLVHAMDGFAGAIGISDSDGKCSPVCSVCIPWNKDLIDTSYYGYLVRQLAVTDYITSLAKGIRERSTEFRYSEFSNLFLAVPSQEEQQNITNFLDHETAKIDTLIIKQEKLIELLKEKRQAVISHAVTKGLNPDAPMKDSGVEWLGEVPEHWDVAPLKFVSTYNDDSLSETTDENYQIEYIDIGSVSAINGVEKTEIFTFSNAPSRARRKLQAGDVIVSTVRTYLEAIAVIDSDKDNLVASTGFCVVRPTKVTDYFAGFALRTRFFIAEVISRSTGISYPAINSSDLVNIKIAYPNEQEQEAINQFVKDQCLIFDSLTEKATNAISLMKERKTALISAAVTGKIDVRDWEAVNE